MKSLVSAVAILAFTASSGLACMWSDKSQEMADADKSTTSKEQVTAGADRATGEVTAPSDKTRTGDQLAKTPSDESETDGGSDR